MEKAGNKTVIVTELAYDCSWVQLKAGVFFNCSLSKKVVIFGQKYGSKS